MTHEDQRREDATLDRKIDARIADAGLSWEPDARRQRRWKRRARRVGVRYLITHGRDATEEGLRDAIYRAFDSQTFDEREYGWINIVIPIVVQVLLLWINWRQTS